MFAVKGWSVDAASLKPQTELFKSPKPGDGDQHKSSKKRKRTHALEAKQDPSVRSDDVGRLWQQHIEGGELSKSQKQRERKKQKTEQNIEEHATTHGLSKEEVRSQGPESTAHGKQKKTDKAKKGKKERPGAKNANPNKVPVSDVRSKAAEASESSGQPRATATNGPQSGQDGTTQAQPTPAPASTPVLTPMQSAMRQKLVSARFRHLNQTLYTEPSAKAKALFDQNPEMFEDYHAGFRQQVSVWPENPLDTFIRVIRERGGVKPAPKVRTKGPKANANFTKPMKDRDQALPRTHGTAIIADLGCGDARLAQTLTASGDTNNLNLRLHSFDLHGKPPHVTPSDIANLPLKDDSVDVAILCLALMGTNWISFIEEAYRILHWKGELWIAEIKSRFGRVSKVGKPVEHSVGGKRKQALAQKAQETKAKEQENVNEQETLQTEVDGAPVVKEETDVSAFVEVLKRRGFVVKPPSEDHIDLRNKMFVKMEFVKALAPSKGKGKPEASGQGGTKPKGKSFTADEEEDVDSGDEAKVLKPCLYKIR